MNDGFAMKSKSYRNKAKTIIIRERGGGGGRCKRKIMTERQASRYKQLRALLQSLSQ